MAEIIDINGPNRRWGKHRVEVVLQLWDNRKVYEKDVGGNCIGWAVIDSAIEEIIDEIAMDGRVILTSPDDEELTVDDAADDDDWDERIRKMVVSARIIGYTAPTLNEVRARNGADPVPDGDKPSDYDAEIVARRKSEAAA
ncbi:DUF5406 family protein [Azospirillum argentinense]|uniref:DUF5406 family protein n=1 Tax=Azospirillum argentinense TaxID=2970906 RepID=A0ABW8V518_9PROT